GIDPRVVRDCISAFAAQARNGSGPALIECRGPRLWGHYNRDIQHYRTPPHKAKGAARDPIAHFSQLLLAEGVITNDSLEQLKQEVSASVAQVVERVALAPGPDPSSALDHVYSPTVSK